MPDDANSNGKNGKSTGLVDTIKTGVKEDIESLKTDLPAKAKESLETLKSPTKTQVYTSIFRHKHDDTPRNRALGVHAPAHQVGVPQPQDQPAVPVHVPAVPRAEHPEHDELARWLLRAAKKAPARPQRAEAGAVVEADSRNLAQVAVQIYH